MSDKSPNLKQDEMQRCSLCNEYMGHDGEFSFFRIKIEHFILDSNAVRRQAGLEMMLGGNARLAFVMGPDEDFAKLVEASDMIFVCAKCASDPHLNIHTLKTVNRQ